MIIDKYCVYTGCDFAVINEVALSRWEKMKIQFSWHNCTEPKATKLKNNPNPTWFTEMKSSTPTHPTISLSLLIIVLVRKT